MDNISFENSYAEYYGGIIYATSSSSTTSIASSEINIINTLSIIDSESKYDGGSFYIDHESLSIYMNTVVTLSESYSSIGYGGVFYFK